MLSDISKSTEAKDVSLFFKPYNTDERTNDVVFANKTSEKSMECVEYGYETCSKE